MNEEELKEFLRAPELRNCNHPLLRANAESITREASTPIDAALRIFCFVKDKIRLAFVNPWKTASETLRMGKGSCLKKATLQVALLRSVARAGKKASLRFRFFKSTTYYMSAPSSAAIVSAANFEFPVRV